MYFTTPIFAKLAPVRRHHMGIFRLQCQPYRLGNVEISVLIYIQQDATLHSLFYLETILHVSGGTSTHHQERKQLYLQHLVFVTPLLLPSAIVEELEPV